MELYMSSTHPLAGSQVLPEMLVNVPLLVSAYYTGQPDPSISTQRVAFGTSGHRGCSFDLSFNEWHVLAISQAICEYRSEEHTSELQSQSNLVCRLLLV